MNGKSLRWLGGLVAIVFVAASCGGTPATSGTSPSPTGKAFIPLISKGFQHQFWQAVKQGAEKAAIQFNVRIDFQGPENESQVDKQLEMLQTVLNQKPSALCFAALDSKAAIPLLQKFKDAKIPVIGFDSGVDSDIPLATAATDNIAAAGAAADKMAALIGGSGEVAIVAQDPIGIGFKCVEAAVNALKGQTLQKNIDTGYKYYDKTNIDNPDIAALLYK